MKTYEVWYKVNVSKMAYIEANSLEEAEAEAETMGGDLFTDCDAEWELDREYNREVNKTKIL